VQEALDHPDALIAVLGVYTRLHSVYVNVKKKTKEYGMKYGYLNHIFVSIRRIWLMFLHRYNIILIRSER
jgi:hypothetical protein